MARNGRDFEKLIATLERLLGKDNVRVTTPDSIKGIYSESNREIDISLLATDPSGNLTIIECRDRKGNEDVGWIEQLVTKQIDVGAYRVIAVSSTGFSEGAIKLAKAFGIVLRTSVEVSPEIMASWFAIKEMPQINRYAYFNHISLKFDPKYKILPVFPPVVLKAMNPPFDTNAPIFICKNDGCNVSWNGIWRSCHHDSIYADVPLDGTKIKKRIQLVVSHRDVVYQIITTSEPFDIFLAIIDVELWNEVINVPVEKARMYNEMDKNLAQSVEFGTVIDGEPYTIGFNFDPLTKNQSLSIRKKENIDK